MEKVVTKSSVDGESRRWTNLLASVADDDLVARVGGDVPGPVELLIPPTLRPKLSDQLTVRQVYAHLTARQGEQEPGTRVST